MSTDEDKTSLPEFIPLPAEEESQLKPALSKKAQKRAAKAEHFAATKLERRAREKQARKEKKRQTAAKRAAGELDEDEASLDASREKKKRRIANVESPFGGRVVVDLGFDDKMSEKEIKSLCSQLAYTYSANRNAAFPFSLIFTSLNGQTFTKLENLNDGAYRRWSRTEWWSEDFDKLWKTADLAEASDAKQSDSETLAVPEAAPLPETASCSQHSVVYLTADAEDELEELKPDEVYVIGGLCDHNREKNICYNKSKSHGIRSARLPIGRYVASLPTRKVLTVNQAFEILLKWTETRDWEKAFYSIIPKRKFQGQHPSEDVEEGQSSIAVEPEPEQND